MKLAYLTGQYGRASDTFIRQEVVTLRRLGHVVDTFSSRRPPAEHEISEEVRAERASTTYILDAGAVALAWSVLRAFAQNPSASLAALRLAFHTSAPGVRAMLLQMVYFAQACFLAGQLRRRKIDHLHNHIAMNSATVAMLAARISGVSWSMTVHGPHDFFEPSYWALPEKLRRASFSVFISEYGRSQAMMLVEPSYWGRFHVVRCGLDDEFLLQQPTPVPDEPKLLFVGRLSPEKGIFVLIEAIAALRERGVAAEVTLIGDGPSRRDVEALVARCSLEAQVRLLGWRAPRDVRAELCQSKALVLPSFAEGLPIVIMEALATHRPVVSTYVAGIPELVEPDVSGLLVPAGSVASLADAIARVLSAPSSRLQEWAAAGARRVARDHNGLNNVRQLERLFLGQKP